jgi:hypothetical protein
MENGLSTQITPEMLEAERLTQEEFRLSQRVVTHRQLRQDAAREGAFWSIVSTGVVTWDIKKATELQHIVFDGNTETVLIMTVLFLLGLANSVRMYRSETKEINEKQEQLEVFLSERKSPLLTPLV